MTINDFLNFANYVSVLFFGVIVSLYLADFPFKEHRQFYCLTLSGFGIAQIIFYLIMGESSLYKCYPLLIHLPLILLIRFVLHQNHVRSYERQEHHFQRQELPHNYWRD